MPEVGAARGGDEQGVADAADGVRLTGGLSTPVVLRRGDAVHRTAGPWTPTIHRLLEHLHRCGVSFVPRALGMDEERREVLTHLPGRVPTYPMPHWVWSTRVLDTAGRQLAQVHAASRTFLAAEEAAAHASTWQEDVRSPAEVVCLNDVGPYNMVFSTAAEGAEVDVTGWIDVDKASPGPRVRDLAHLAYRIVPLTSTDVTGAGPVDIERYRRRLRRLCEAYGEAGDRVVVGPADVVSSFVDLLQASAEDADRKFAAGATVFEGHGDFYRHEMQWLFANLGKLLEWAGSSGEDPAQAPLPLQHRA